jgi:hypothetical protein
MTKRGGRCGSLSSRRTPGPVTLGIGWYGRYLLHCRNVSTRRTVPAQGRDDVDGEPCFGFSNKIISDTFNGAMVRDGAELGVGPRAARTRWRLLTMRPRNGLNSRATVYRHGRARPGHPRLCDAESKTWMPGTSPGMTSHELTAFQTHLRDLAASCARVLQIHPPHKIRGRRRPSREGAGKTGCALHPRSRVQGVERDAHEHTGSAEAVRPSLRNGFTVSFVLSSVTGFIVTVAAPKLQHDLTPAPGRRDHTTSPSASCAVRLRARLRPPHPIPTFVTMANVPS